MIFLLQGDYFIPYLGIGQKPQGIMKEPLLRYFTPHRQLELPTLNIFHANFPPTLLGLFGVASTVWKKGA